MRLQLAMLKVGRTLRIGSIALYSIKCDMTLPLAAYLWPFVGTSSHALCLQHVDDLAGHLTDLENRVSKRSARLCSSQISELPIPFMQLLLLYYILKALEYMKFRTAQ